MPLKYGHILRSFADRENNWSRGLAGSWRFCRWECRTILNWRLMKAERKCEGGQRGLVLEKRGNSRCGLPVVSSRAKVRSDRDRATRRGRDVRSAGAAASEQE